MIFLVSEILVYLVLSLALGLATGWTLHLLRSTRRSGTIDARSQNRIEVADALRDKFRSDKEVVEARLRDTEGRLDDSEERRELQVAEIASLKIDMSGILDKDTAINTYRNQSDSLRQQLRTATGAVADYRSQLELKARETAEYRLQAEKARQEVQRMKKKHESGSGSIESKSIGFDFDAQPATGSTDEMLSNLESLITTRDVEIGDLRNLLDKSETEAKDMRQQTEMSRSQLHALEVQLKDWQEARSTTSQSRNMSTSTDSHTRVSLDRGGEPASQKLLRKELAERTRKYAVLETDYKILKKTCSDLETRLDSTTALHSEDGATDSDVSAEIADDYQPQFLLSAPYREPDDLKVIFGIGPVIEATLNDLGIFYFDQIEKFEEQDFRWVASNINSFPKRIVQDDWVGQASALAKAGL